MAFVVRYPDRRELLEPMIAFAREELEHFHRVYRILESRGLTLGPDEKDPYVTALHQHVRSGRDERLLDRLVMASVVEARGCERFALVAAGLPGGELRDFYEEIVRSEARHQGLFLRLARAYFDPGVIETRVGEWLDLEGDVVARLAIRPGLH
jgi:tRNA-(ms[2]io[6]A)-hydroxylase